MGAKIKKMFSRITIITLFAIMAPNALAQSPQMMRGMMGNEDIEQMHGQGFGYGYGQMGMGCGGWGRMMGPGYGYGMGNMGSGYGMGMGYMGGMMGSMMGMGPLSMMSGYGIYQLGLTAEQRTKLRDIRRDLRDKNWKIMGSMMDEFQKLQDLYAEEKLNPTAINSTYKKIFDYRLQMIDQNVAAMNKFRDLLTKEQQDKLKTYNY